MKKFRNVLMISALFAGMLSISACGNKEESDVTTSEKLVVKDVTVARGQTLEIEYTLPSSYEGDDELKYSFSGYNILIEGNSVTGLKENTETKVKATTSDGKYSTYFNVSVTESVFSVDDLILYTGFDAKPNIKFDGEGTVTFKVVDEKIATYNKEENLFQGIKVGKTKVEATVDSYSTSFFITVTNMPDRISGRVETIKNTLKEQNYPQNQTIFVGDSFFDPWSWSNFYSLYEGKNVNLLGVSTAQSIDWDIFLQSFIADLNPKNIVLHLGTNDIFDAGYNDTQTYENMKTLIDNILEEVPNAKLYYFGIEPRYSGGTTKNNYCKNVNELLIKNITNERFVYLDSPALCYNEDGTVKGEFFRDNVHPKLENYTEYVRLLNEANIEIDDK